MTAVRPSAAPASFRWNIRAERIKYPPDAMEEIYPILIQVGILGVVFIFLLWVLMGSDRDRR